MSLDSSGNASPQVGNFLEEAVGHVKIWSGAEPISVDHEPNDVVRIASLRPTLVGPSAQPLSKCLERTFEGVFFPALLLCSGWWELQEAGVLADEISWRHELQYWLFSGFEKWGPSWRLTPSEVKDEDFIFGQMGEGDEAESLAVIIAASKAPEICARMATGERAFSVRATGILCHRDMVRDVGGLRHQIRQWGKSFEYCLVVYGDVPQHKVIPGNEQPQLYSGYIWQCVMPEAFCRYTDGTLQDPELRDAFFLWEHTNFASQSAIDYNVESLSWKREYVTREFGKLITLQKSMHLVEGECALSEERFYQFIRGAMRPAGGGS